MLEDSRLQLDILYILCGRVFFIFLCWVRDGTLKQI